MRWAITYTRLRIAPAVGMGDSTISRQRGVIIGTCTRSKQLHPHSSNYGGRLPAKLARVLSVV